MEYINDKEKKYLGDIRTGLKNHNLQYVSYDNYEKCFYYMEDDQLVGAMNTEYFCNWCTIDTFFYRDLKVLQALISKVKEVYQDKIVGIKLIIEHLSVVNEFKHIGFNHIGSTVSTTLIPENYFMTCTDVVPDKSVDGVLIKDEPIEAYENILEDKRLKYEEEKYDAESIVFVALDDNKFIGGLEAVKCADYMYVSRLIVDEAMKNKGIGSKLMTMVEDKAKSLDLHCMLLGTSDFQAKDFYMKLGYDVYLTKENIPKGYDSYSLVKKL